MHELPWIAIFESRVRRFANNFHEWRSHGWKSLADHIKSDPKIVIHGNECIILFLTRYQLMSWTHNSPITIIDRWFRHCRQGQSFLIQYCDVTTVDLWRHVNVGHWHYDVIFVDCSCTRKVAQRRSLLVNNSREYRYVITRYSRLSV